MKNSSALLPSALSPEELFTVFDSLGNSMLGFNRDWSRKVASCAAASGKDGYPPYNLYKRKSKDTGNPQFIVEVACSGFSPEELDVTVEKDQLTISGRKDGDSEVVPDNEYIHRGIAKRKFALSFILERNVRVQGSSFVNGILQVIMEQIIPEEELPKQIPIITS